MKKSTFFAIENSNKKKVRNFIILAKRMGVDYNDDFVDYNEGHRFSHLGFSNTWDGTPPEALRCSYTNAGHDVTISIDSADGYIKAVSRLIQEINELDEVQAPIVQKFDDKHGNELFVGNTVTIVDIEDLEEIDLALGDILHVTRLIDVEPNFIEFKSQKNGSLYSFYGHRVVKIQYQ
jgi:hypothetical protein